MLNTSLEHDVNQPPSDVLLVYRKKAVTIFIPKYSCRLYKAQPYKGAVSYFRQKGRDSRYGEGSRLMQASAKGVLAKAAPPRFGESLLPKIAFTFKWGARA